MPRLGETLAGRYRVDAPLGAGGMATVYRARDLRLDRDIALKVLLPNLAADAVLVERFGREAHALAAVNHPAVVAVYDVEPGDPAAGREPFYVMELCPDGSLADRLRAVGPLPPAQAVPLLASVADGLAELHRQGLLHRDVKPHNILLAGARAKIGDFGVVLVEDATDRRALTADGTTLGTLAYLAPERLTGLPASRAADVYGLGAAAFETLTGRRPRPSTTVEALVARRDEPPPLVSSVRPELGTAFDAPVAAALAPDPADRPDAGSFGRLLRAAYRSQRRRVLAAAGDPAPARGVPIVATPDGPMAASLGGATAALGGATRAVAGPGLSYVGQAARLRHRAESALRPGRPVMGDETTEAAIPVQGIPAGGPIVRRGVLRPLGSRPRRATRPRRRAGDLGRAIAVAAVALLVIALVGAMLLSRLGSRLTTGQSGAPGGAGGALASATPSGPPSASPSPSASPIASADPAPSPSPSPSPTPSALGVQAAIDAMRAAISGARGSGGLTGKEAKPLEDQVAQISDALDRGDQAAAGAAADRLTTDVMNLVLEGRVSGPAGDALLSAALALGAAIPSG